MKIVRARVEDAPLVHALMHAAFDEYRQTLQPPSSAHDETLDDVALAIQQGGALLVWDGEQAVASARFEPRPDCLYVGRVAVLPSHRRRGIAAAIMAEMLEVARSYGLPSVFIGVRESLPSNFRLYASLGYEVVEIEPHPRGPDRTIWMRKTLADPGCA